MDFVRLGRTEVEVPTIGLGTWPLSGPNVARGMEVGWSGHDDALATQALIHAYEVGFTHWDTADAYGDGQAERLIGDVLKDLPRAEIFIATKVGWDPGEYSHYYHPDQIRRQLLRSLANLGVDVIDLYYLHHCDFGPESEYLDDAIETVQRIRDEGKIRFIGLSDWKSELVLKYAPLVDPDVVQIYRNVRNDEYGSSGLREWAEAHDVGAVFFSPLDHGLLLGKYSEPVTFASGDFRNRVAGFRDPDLLAVLQSNREKLIERFRDHPQPVLHGLVGSLLADSTNSCVLVGMRNPNQVDVAAAATQALTGEDAEWVRSLYSSLGG